MLRAITRAPSWPSPLGGPAAGEGSGASSAGPAPARPRRAPARRAPARWPPRARPGSAGSGSAAAAGRRPRFRHALPHRAQLLEVGPQRRELVADAVGDGLERPLDLVGALGKPGRDRLGSLQLRVDLLRRLSAQLSGALLRRLEHGAHPLACRRRRGLLSTPLAHPRERTGRLLLDPEGAAHERVDAAEVRVGARVEVVRRLPVERSRRRAARVPSVPDSNCTWPSAIG